MKIQSTRQLTLRGLDKELERRLNQLSRRERVSLNKAALIMIRKGAGLSQPRSQGNTVGSTLDDLIGSWTAEEERRFLDAVRELDRIDSSLWS